MADETDTADAESTGTTSDDTDSKTTERIRTLAIFFIGIGVFAVVGAGLDQAALLAENLTTYFVSGFVILGIGVLLAALTRF